MASLMTRDDSITIVAMVCAAWPGKDWDAAQLDSYARAIEGCDAQQATDAVLRAQKELRYRPSVAELLEFIKIERRLSETDEPMQRRELPKTTRCPDWVKGWCLSRARYGDFRIWPQQDVFAMSQDVMPAEDQKRYMEEGASLSIDQVFQAISV